PLLSESALSKSEPTVVETFSLMLMPPAPRASSDARLNGSPAELKVTAPFAATVRSLPANLGSAVTSVKLTSPPSDLIEYCQGVVRPPASFHPLKSTTSPAAMLLSCRKSKLTGCLEPAVLKKFGS